MAPRQAGHRGAERGAELVLAARAQQLHLGIARGDQGARQLVGLVGAHTAGLLRVEQVERRAHRGHAHPAAERPSPLVLIRSSVALHARPRRACSASLCRVSFAQRRRRTKHAKPSPPPGRRLDRRRAGPPEGQPAPRTRRPGGDTPARSSPSHTRAAPPSGARSPRYAASAQAVERHPGPGRATSPGQSRPAPPRAPRPRPRRSARRRGRCESSIRGCLPPPPRERRYHHAQRRQTLSSPARSVRQSGCSRSRRGRTHAETEQSIHPPRGDTSPCRPRASALSIPPPAARRTVTGGRAGWLDILQSRSSLSQPNRPSTTLKRSRASIWRP